MISYQASSGRVLSGIDSYYLASACSVPGIVLVDWHRVKDNFMLITPLPGGHYLSTYTMTKVKRFSKITY